MTDVLSVLADIEHIPLHPRSTAYRNHLIRTLEKANKLVLKTDSKVDLSFEIADLKQKITEWN